MANRMIEGFKLFKENKVQPDSGITPTNMRFFVESSKKKDNGLKNYYDVIFRDGFWTCECDDWNWRHEKMEGAFICKHGYAAVFKLYDMLSRFVVPVKV